MNIHCSSFIVHSYDGWRPGFAVATLRSSLSLGPRCGLALRATASHRWRGRRKIAGSLEN